MTDVVDTLEFENGITAEIIHDHDVRQPYDENEAVHIVVLSKKHTDPSQGKLGSEPHEVEKWRKDNEAEWYSVNLWAYVHSGIAFKVGAKNPFTVDVRWDSPRAGIVALKRSEWGDGNATDEQLFKYAQGVAEEYGMWADGETFGYVVKDSDDNELHAAWNFIGRDHVEEEARLAAERFVTTADRAFTL